MFSDQSLADEQYRILYECPVTANSETVNFLVWVRVAGKPLVILRWLEQSTISRDEHVSPLLNRFRLVALEGSGLKCLSL
jgi:hypothetical protein